MDVLATSYLLLFFVVAFGLLILGRLVEKLIDKKRHGWVRLLVIVPQGLINPLTEHRPHEIATSTDLYRRLHELNIPFTVEIAVHSVGEEVHFYITVPNLYREDVARLIQTLWHSSYVTEAEDYELWLADTPENSGHVAAGYLAQARPFCIPLKTAQKGHFEPFLGVLRHISSLAAVGESAAVQWVVRKADPRLMKDISDHLQKFAAGEYHPSRHVHEKFVLTPETIKLLEEKARSPLFAVNCRIVTAATAGNAKRILAEVAGHLENGSMAGEQHNSFKLMTPKNHDRLLESFFARSFEPAQEMILTADELATYFHLPGPSTAVPKIRR